MEVFIGTILPVGFNYAPRGWAFCNGQLMSIAQNSALFALLGTTYGGNGQTTFGLPDLRGRVIVGSQAGQQGPGLQPVQPGEMAGTNNVTVLGNGQTSFTLSQNNLPAHTHTATSALQASTNVTGSLNTAAEGSMLSSTPTGAPGAQMYLPTGTAPTAPVNLGGLTTTIGNTGSGAAVVAPVTTQATVSIMQPYTGINYVIALEGIFPSRN
ncbi:tail fiber protein [Ramlibacter sp.]|uniref:phage tail protein n=1 Tax=Ramlibacter sp. TaxID=1917967 RepID=UPI0017B36960|nr:tail fiber protein [Ramlibacter sp.]MBA2672882.1 tail fiber protein [Ramlibacter sp.]